MLDALQQAWQALASIPHIKFYVGLVWATYLVWVGGWIVLQKREPVATLSWLLGLAALPLLGILVYQVFGPRKIERQQRRRDRNALPRDKRSAADSDECTELFRIVEATTSLPPSSLRSVRLINDGAATYAAMIEDIASATRHVHLEYYRFAGDRTGKMILDALVERARAGVQVRLLVDALGSATTPKRFFDPLVEAGGEFCWFHPSRLGRIWTRTWVNLRSHRKIAIIDERVGYTGGINIGDEENEALDASAFHDLHMRLEGDAVRLLHTVFIDDWMYATESDEVASQHDRQPKAAEQGPIRAQVVSSGPDSTWEAIHRVQVGAIHAAKRRIWMATPYFVPGEAAMMALTSAAFAGLDVRVMVPKRSDSMLNTLAARSYFDRLVSAGVQVHEYGPRMLHTKALLIDDHLSIIGTANFDNRSFRLNYEVAILFDDADVARSLEAQLEDDLQHAVRVRGDRARPLWTARLPEAIARLGSPLL